MQNQTPENQPNCKGKMYCQKPVYVDLLPPCNSACPAGENIQAWLDLAEKGKFKEAWEKLIENNPMPAIHGRVCYHPCENGCNRKQHDSTVSIHAVERFLGTLAIEQKWQRPNNAAKTGKKVLVVGAGPAGLSAAYHLKRMGHDVTIHEALDSLGGMMYVGIPDYRLPSNIRDGEIKSIIDMGINVELNKKISDLLQEKEKNKFDAVFLGIGAHIGKLVDVVTNDPCPIYDAIKFLREVKLKTLPSIGKHLVVFGGSNTAMDVARTAKRLGIENVTVAYHRSRQRMAAFQDEITEAIEEGVNLRVLRSLNKIDKNIITLNVVELDEKGSPQPTGELETIEANMLVFALGQNSESGFLKNVSGIEIKSNGAVVVNEQMMTGVPGIFAGGDMLPYDQSVTIATGHGKKAARHIDAYLKGTTYAKPEKHRVVPYKKMNVWFSDKSPKTVQSIMDAETRVKSFAEVLGNLSEKEALYEAKRCLSCGNCFECDGCFGVCPERAITKLGIGKRFSIDYNKCTGCTACAKECPCSAIVMQDVK